MVIAAERTSAIPFLAGLWERLRASPRLKFGFLYGLAALAAILGNTLPTSSDPTNPESFFAEAERFAFDTQMRLVREHFPRYIDNDVVLIGTDEETEQVFTEPIALWHRHFAKVMHALARVKPAAVGVDFVLPERSFDAIMPGSDMAIMRGLFDLRGKSVLVYVQNVDSKGRLVPVQRNFGNIVKAENLGIDQQLKDPDAVSRRFSERTLGVGEPVPTLVGQILRGLGKPVGEGYIDYTVGGPLLRYVPMHLVAAWADRGDERQLREAFAGRIVLIGGLVGSTDRWLMPVKLMELPEEKERPRQLLEAAGRLAKSQPGVLVHLQVLRSHLANGLLKPVSDPAGWALCALALLAVLVHARAWIVGAIALAAPAILLASSMALIYQAQLLVPLASVVLCFWIALLARGLFDATEAVIERLRLKQAFAGQVSPAVMREMMHGGLTPGVNGQLAEICVLFSDVRDFTTLSERMPPGIVTTVLQRYFDGMVRAVHKYNGTVDKFMGDGMMVLFGAPVPLEDPCSDAVKCALAMMAELDALNEEFSRENLPTLTIGIGVNYGTVTVGNIGSSERHNYSAIGDAVNVAARVEGLTKELGRKIIITESVVSRIGERYHFDPLGEHKVKGHSPVKVWGIRTARATPAAA